MNIHKVGICRDPHIRYSNGSIGKLYDQWVPPNVNRVEVQYDHIRRVTVIHWTNSQHIPHHMDMPEDNVLPVVVAMRLSC